MFSNYEEEFSRSDLNYYKFYLHNNQYILNQFKTYSDNIFKECNELIDLFCIQAIREIAHCLLEESDFEIESFIWRCISTIDDLEIDFNLFVLLGGEKYLNSDSYELESACEQNQYNILSYFIDENYSNVVRLLLKHYKDNQSLLLNVIDDMPYKDSYVKAVSEIETLEDMCDNANVVRTFEWAENGFSLYGE